MLIQGATSFYLFTTFTSEVKQMWHMYKCVLKHPFRQDIFKLTYRNVMFRDYILTFAICIYCLYSSLNTWGIKFKKAEYFFKHFSKFLLCAMKLSIEICLSRPFFHSIICSRSFGVLKMKIRFLKHQLKSFGQQIHEIGEFYPFSSDAARCIVHSVYSMIVQY